MIYLAPNVYVLEYLMNTKQLSGANEESAYRFIQSGNSIQVWTKDLFCKKSIYNLETGIIPRYAPKLKVIIVKMNPTPKNRNDVHLLISRLT